MKELLIVSLPNGYIWYYKIKITIYETGDKMNIQTYLWEKGWQEIYNIKCVKKGFEEYKQEQLERLIAWRINAINI